MIDTIKEYAHIVIDVLTFVAFVSVPLWLMALMINGSNANVIKGLTMMLGGE